MSKKLWVASPGGIWFNGLPTGVHWGHLGTSGGV